MFEDRSKRKDGKRFRTVQIPTANIDRCMLDASKKSKAGVKWKSGVILGGSTIPLKYSGSEIVSEIQREMPIPNPELDHNYEDHVDQQLVKVQTSRILRTRPIFDDWSVEFDVTFDQNVLDENEVLDIARTAGNLIGFLEGRPRMGRFTATRVK
jgi:hypothetical protein